MTKITIELNESETTLLDEYANWVFELTNIKPVRTKICKDMVMAGLRLRKKD